MKKFAFIIISVIAVMGSRIEGQPRMPADSIASWQSDIDYLVEKIIQIHPRYRDCGLQAELNSAKANLRLKIGSLTDTQIVVELQKLLASVGDGHTILYPFGMKKGTLLRIPLMFWLFDDGLFVIDAPQRQLIGQKVLSIGSLKVDELLLNLTPYISHDNNQQFLWAAPFYCTLTDFLMAAGAIKNRDSATIVFGNNVKYSFTAKPVDPEKIEIKLIPPLNEIAPAYLMHRNDNFRVEEIRPDVLYVAVNSMNDTSQKTLEEFGKELRKLLKPYKKMVLDLRYNNGGEASKADELFKTCVAFDVEGGKIAVLVSRMTFSAAQTFATRIDQWTSAFFVGEKTGSKPNHYGNERQFKLPFSGLRGSISSGYNQPVSANDSRIFISPEIEVRVNSENFYSGKDPEIDAALNELNKY
ncbi:MAG: S41 family peptidase [Ignavibacteriales bacterium]